MIYFGVEIYFVFIGFLSKKPGKARKQLEKALRAGETVVFYESPHRIMKTLDILSGLEGEHDAAVAREISKHYEEVLRGTPQEIVSMLQKNPDKVRGEITVVLKKR